MNERKEQYKQVRAHVKKEDGRMQAYGWSLPAKVPQQGSNSVPGTTSPAPTSDDVSPKGGSVGSNANGSSVPVPVPVYCRPLMEKEPGMKVFESMRPYDMLRKIIIIIHPMKQVKFK